MRSEDNVGEFVEVLVMLFHSFLELLFVLNL